MTRLTDLNPKWVPLPQSFVPADTLAVGITFDCPHCRSQRLAVNFVQPIDPDSRLAETNWRPAQPAWDRKGDTFEDITLLPSVDFSRSGHWHGHITTGEVTTA